MTICNNFDHKVLCLSTGCLTYLLFIFAILNLYFIWAIAFLKLWRNALLCFFFLLLMKFLKWFCAVVSLELDQCDSWVVLSSCLINLPQDILWDKMFFHPFHFVNLIHDIRPGDKLSIGKLFFWCCYFSELKCDHIETQFKNFLWATPNPFMCWLWFWQHCQFRPWICINCSFKQGG